MKLWKWVGLAGIVGAAALGTAVAVNRRRERTWDDDIDPDELRARLHARLEGAASD